MIDFLDFLEYAVVGGDGMPRKKPPVTVRGVTKDPEKKLTVQKSSPLYGLWRSDMTLAEFKILDAYLSRINSKDPEKRRVQFERGELERLLGVVKINTPELKTRLKHLMNPVQVDDPTKTKSFRYVTLFEEAEAEQDERGIWRVSLTCTQAAKKYIFNIENMGYLRYKLRCVTVLKSRYSYILFVYIESNRYRKTWTIGVDELKQLLSCEDDPTYAQFKRFNDRLLKRCCKELTEKTECKFTYEPERTGRVVTDIRFSVETLPAEIFDDYDPNQIQMEEYLTAENASVGEDQYKERLQLLSEMCGNEFSKEEVAELLEDMLALPFEFGDDIALADYLRRQYTKLKTQAARNERKGNSIKNRFSYLKKIIKKAESISN